MKSSIVILFIFSFQFLLQAQVSIKVIDAGTDISLKKIEVIRQDSNGKIVEKKTTNSEGIAKFKNSSGTILIPELSNEYKHFPIELFKDDKNKELVYFVYPASFLALSPSYLKENETKTKTTTPTNKTTNVIDEIDNIRVEAPKDQLNPKNLGEESRIIEYPDQEASFPGGTDAMKSYLSSKVIYPRYSLVMGQKGRVFVEFIVEKDGSITQAKIIRGVSEAIDLEAIRVINNMPNWTPAKSKGKEVRARCRVPISFTLQ